MSYDPGAEPPQPSPAPATKPPTSDLWLAMKVLVASVTACVIFLGATVWFQQFRTLEGVAVFRTGLSVNICSRSKLTNCTVRTGLSGGRERVQGPFPAIDSVPSCDSQIETANGACRGATNQAACVASMGVVLVEAEGLTRVSDPRDQPSSLDAHTIRIECEQGTYEGRWNEPNP